VDEIIVPKTRINLVDMIRDLDSAHPFASHYKFRSATFYTFLEDSPYEEDSSEVAVSLKKSLNNKLLLRFNKYLNESKHQGTKYQNSGNNHHKLRNKYLRNKGYRSLFIFRKFNRSEPFDYSRGTKCIVKPHRIAEAGIHDALPLNTKYKAVDVPFQLGAVHHYRDAYIDPRNIEDVSILDFSVLNFTSFFTRHRPFSTT